MADPFLERDSSEAAIPFFQLARSLAQNSSLTWEARGLLSYLHSLPPGWRINPAHLITQGPGGRQRMYRMLRELVDHGYMTRTDDRDAEGKIVRWTYLVRMRPLPRKPEVAKPEVANEHSRKDRDTDPATDERNGASDDAPRANDLIKAWIDSLNNGYRPTQKTITVLARKLKEMLADGLQPVECSAALAEWQRRRIAPGSLPYVADDLRKQAAGLLRSDSNRRPSAVETGREVLQEHGHNPDDYIPEDLAGLFALTPDGSQSP